MTDIATAPAAVEAAPVAPAAAPVAPAPAPVVAEPAAPAAPIVSHETPAAPAKPERVPLSDPRREGRATVRELAKVAAEQFKTTGEQLNAAIAERAGTAAPAAADPAPAAEPAVAINAAGRPYNPATGQLLPANAGGEGIETPATPAGEPPAAVAEPAAPAEAPRLVRIMLPEGDVRRLVGGRDYVDVTPELEQITRWNINNFVRNQEVADLRRQLIERDAETSALSKWRKSDSYKAHEAKFNSLKDQEEAGELAEGTASAYWQIVQAEFQTVYEAEVQERETADEASALEAAANTWVEDAKRGVQRGFPREVQALPQFGQWFDAAVESFNDGLERGLFPHVTDAKAGHKAFARYFTDLLRQQPAAAPILERYVARPAVQQPPRIEAPAAPQPTVPMIPESEMTQRIEAAVQAAVANLVKDGAGRRNAAPPHPMANVSAAVKAESAAVVDETPEIPPGLSHSELRRQQRAGARDLGRRYGQQSSR